MARRLLVCVGLVVATAAVYLQTAEFGFISFDDKIYVSENPPVLGGLTPDGVRWAFTSFDHAGNWHPLTWLSHMLDVSLFGPDRPGAFHVLNALLHAVASVLLFLALDRMTRDLWASAFVAALFALHPMHVESVAWISERKDVLSGALWMASTWAYVEYAIGGRRRAYALSLAAFALGLLAKPVLVTFPFALLLLDAWPLQRSQAIGRLLVEKLPFLLLVAVSVAATLVAQQEAMAYLDVPFGDRVANAVVSYAAYLGKLAWPTDLAVFYPHPNGAGQAPLSWLRVLGALVVLVGVTVAAGFAASRGRRYWLVGWLWYLGILVPMIGIVQVGGAALADRYTYISAIGLFVMLAWGARDAVRAGWVPSWILTAVGVALLVACGLASHRQAALWRDDFSLFGHAVAVTHDNPLAHGLLGVAYANRDEVEAAKEHLQLAVELDPRNAQARDILGRILVKEGRNREAIPLLTEALALRKEDPRLRYFLARALLAEGRREQALTELDKSLELRSQRETETRARRLRAREYERDGRMREAVRDYRRILALDPYSVAALTRLGWIYATDPRLRDPLNALAFALEACRVTNFEASRSLEALAAAYAAGGDFENAVATAENALERLPVDSGHLRGEAEMRLAHYRRQELPPPPSQRR